MKDGKFPKDVAEREFISDRISEKSWVRGSRNEEERGESKCGLFSI